MANLRLTEAMLEVCDYSDQTILDIGCGDGTYTWAIWSLGKPRSIVAIDPAASAIQSANERRQDENVEFVEGNAYQLDYPDNTFDVAMLRGVLHHLDNPEQAIREALRVAKRVVVVEPNGYNPVLKIIEKLSAYHREHDEKSYSPALLDRWFNESGAGIARYVYIGLVPMFCPDWMARILKAVEPFFEKLPVVRKLYCGQYVFCAERKS